MRIVHDVAGRQTTMQRTRDIQPVDGEALFQAFQQRCRRLRMLQPPGDLAKLGHAVLLIQLPGCAHE
jgi:hypothetical protein